MITRAGGTLVDAVGRTPLVRLRSIDQETPGVEIWAKLEFANPGGSVKDRAARQMILDAEASGKLRPGMHIIDSTSGNTGVALALFGAARGYKVTLVMPGNVSPARKRIANLFGADVVFSDPMDGSDGAIRLVRDIVTQEPGRYFYTDQYSNASNPRAHFLTTAPELLASLGEKLTHFVTGIGTSGTVIGTGRRLKLEDTRIQVIGLEPEDAFHGLEGLKHLQSSIVPKIYDARVLDRTIFMNTEVGWEMTERVGRKEGLLVGHSSGANVAGALKVAREIAARGETGAVATILCDHASRYVEVG